MIAGFIEVDPITAGKNGFLASWDAREQSTHSLNQVASSKCGHDLSCVLVRNVDVPGLHADGVARNRAMRREAGG